MKMSVFQLMKLHHLETGKVMQEQQFTNEIVSKFPQDEIVKGLLEFDRYLDNLRKEAS